MNVAVQLKNITGTYSPLFSVYHVVICILVFIQSGPSTA